MPVRRVMGFGCICFGSGMICMNFMPDTFWAVVLIIALLLLGYNLFCKKC